MYSLTAKALSWSPLARNSLCTLTKRKNNLFAVAILCLHAGEHRAVSTVDIEALRVLFCDNHGRQTACHATSIHAPVTIKLENFDYFELQISNSKFANEK